MKTNFRQSETNVVLVSQAERAEEAARGAKLNISAHLWKLLLTGSFDSLPGPLLSLLASDVSLMLSWLGICQLSIVHTDHVSLHSGCDLC